jgi:import receptor subunit TOM22
MDGAHDEALKLMASLHDEDELNNELSRLHDEGIAADLDDDDEDADETLAERLIGLTEMFPERARSLICRLSSVSWSTTKWLYSAGRISLWVVASSATILALPIMFENERSQMEEQQIQQQRQLLLGPNAAMSASGHIPSVHSGMMPQVTPPGAGSH